MVGILLATNLIGRYRDGADVERCMPLLSTWLGHDAPKAYLLVPVRTRAAGADREWIDAIAEAER